MTTIYHETQLSELCALHALNNLFQEKYFSKAILDDICVQWVQFYSSLELGEISLANLIVSSPQDWHPTSLSTHSEVFSDEATTTSKWSWEPYKWKITKRFGSTKESKYSYQDDFVN